jgi:endoglucanase
MKFSLKMLALAGVMLASPALSAGLPVGPCVNAGNHFDIADDDNPGAKKLGEDDFARMHKVGFQTVRLTVNWSRHFVGESDRLDPAFLARIGKLIDSAISNKLNVLLDSHNFKNLDEEPVATAPKLAAAWAQIAKAYADKGDDHLWYELSNEPHGAFDNGNLMAVLAPSLAAVRAVSPNKPVVIGGQNWSGVDSLATLNLPDDPQVYPTFHYYEPFDFTHQGASWVKPMMPLGRIYGGEADKARLVRDAAKVAAYVARTGRVPLMGEVGAYEVILPEQRVAYHTAVTAAFAAQKVDQCVWGYTNTFPFYDHRAGKWNKELLKAIGLKD